MSPPPWLGTAVGTAVGTAPLGARAGQRAPVGSVEWEKISLHFPDHDGGAALCLQWPRAPLPKLSATKYNPVAVVRSAVASGKPASARGFRGALRGHRA